MAVSGSACSAKAGLGGGAGVHLVSLMLTVALLANHVGAQTLGKLRTAPSDTLRICVLNSAPDLSLQAGVTLNDNTLLTSTEANNKLQGLSLDMINTVFGQILQWPYSVRYFNPGTTGFSQVAYRTRMGLDCDVGVQSFFISASRDLCTSSCQSPAAGTVFNVDGDYEKYLCCLDFSYPYYAGGWSFMSQVSTGGNIDYISVFFQRDIVQAICVAVICLFFMAHLIWLIERTQFGKSLLLTNPKEGFSRYYLDGLKDGVWFSTTTLMNGVVNAEKTIITPFGRLIATTWVLFGILMSAFVTAVIAASLTTSQLTTTAIMTANDVAGRTVCTAEGFFSAFFDSAFPGIGVQKVIKPTISDCYPMVSAGTVDAAFSIREEALGYFAEGHGAGLIIAPIVKSQGYGMIWSQGWPYADWVNEAILLWQQNVVATQPPYTDSIQKWYYGDSHQITYGGNVQAASQEWNWGLIGTAVALIVVYMSLQTFVIIAHWHMKRQEQNEDRSVAGSKSEAGQKSFFLRAASAIAAPPGALSIGPADAETDPGVPGRAASFNPSMRMSVNASSNKVHSAATPSRGHRMSVDQAVSFRTPAAHVTPPASQSGSDAAALSDILKKLDLLMLANLPVGSAPLTPKPDLDVCMTITSKPSKSPMIAQQEPSKLPRDGEEAVVTEVKKFADDAAWS